MEQTKYLWGVAVLLIAVAVSGYFLMSSKRDKTDDDYSSYNQKETPEIVENIENDDPKNDDSGQATFLTPDKKAINFDFNGGYETVIIGADGKWSIADSPEWIKTYNKDGELIINTTYNKTDSVRDGYIKLSGKGDVTATIKVTQTSKCTHITPASDKVKFEKEGGTQTVNIDTDGMPQVEVTDGFSAYYSSGVLTINAPANKKGAKSGKIKLTCNDQSAYINVSQKGNICSKCKGTGKVKCTKCGGRGIVEGTDEYIGAWFEEGCRKCGGRGYYALWGESSESDVHRGSGKMKCPKCGGRGY